MKWLRQLWCDLVEYINQEPPCVIEFHEVYEKAEKYDRLQKHYPNILARLNAAVDRKERN